MLFFSFFFNESQTHLEMNLLISITSLIFMQYFVNKFYTETFMYVSFL